MNFPNKLTLSRVFMIPFFVGCLFVQNISDDLFLIACFRWAAFVIFILASITDYYDGVLARRWNMITNFGRLFDPLADKLLTMAAFVAFVELRVPSARPIFPAWSIIVVLSREFLVTGLRSIAVSQGRVIQADRWGKQKTVSQLAAILVILFILCVRDTLRVFHVNVDGLDRWLPPVFIFMLCIVVFFTVMSGLVYLVKNWDMITDRE